jgi:hypothetical protein
MDIDLSLLSKPFPAKDIEWRVQSAGVKNEKPWAMVLAYVTNRAIMERLDDVVGAGNWKNEFKEWMKDSVLCGISIKIGEEWVTKWDGADQTDIEATKGGLSGAMKRAAVQWGIGRYLYNLDATMATILDHGEHYQKAKKDSYPAFKWNAPILPEWALPKKVKEAGNQGAIIDAINKKKTIKELDMVIQKRVEYSWTPEQLKEQNELIEKIMAFITEAQ